jgi:hypothetical protein
MPVLIEGISVVVRVDRIANKARGGLEEFRKIIPNQNYCADGELVRVGFMAPDDAKAFVSELERMGLQFKGGQKAVDLVVVDQLRGPTTECDWVEFGYSSSKQNPEQRIALVRMVDGKSHQVAMPPSWKFEGSLSQSAGFVPTENISKKYRFLRTENGVEVYLDLETGKEKYIGRTTGNG